MRPKIKKQYVAFFRGINVGGHHKLPMEDLKKQLKTLTFKNIITILNSGNVIFESEDLGIESLENYIQAHLEQTYGFPVPTIVMDSAIIQEICSASPFKDVDMTKDIRLYVSFLKDSVDPVVKLPWRSEDHSFRIIEKRNKTVFSILDLSASKTTNAMKALEDFFGKSITTRNWNTIERIQKKLSNN